MRLQRIHEMATTVSTWSEHPGDITAEGLTIGGIAITYAELRRSGTARQPRTWALPAICSRCGRNQGGRDYAQLVDWLYQYAEETNPRADITVTIGDYQTRYQPESAHREALRGCPRQHR